MSRLSMGEVRKAVIPAAGLGTRFLPATKVQPKEMLRLLINPRFNTLSKSWWSRESLTF